MMRTCPKCGGYYADDSLAFCLADGMPLISVDPSSERWNEGSQVIEQKEQALRKEKRRLKWQRIVASVITTLILTMAAANSFTVETTTAGTIPPLSLSPSRSPSAPPLPSLSPLPSASPSPSPSPSPRASPSPSPTLVYKISGRVMSETKPLSSVKIKLEGSKLTSIWTDANGYYTFSDLRAGGSYTITPMAPMNFKPSSRFFNDLRRDESADFFGESNANQHPLRHRHRPRNKKL